MKKFAVAAIIAFALASCAHTHGDDDDDEAQGGGERVEAPAAGDTETA